MFKGLKTTKYAVFFLIVIAPGKILSPICAWAWYLYNEDPKPDLCCFCLSLKRLHSKKFLEHFFKISYKTC